MCEATRPNASAHSCVWEQPALHALQAVTSSALRHRPRGHSRYHCSVTWMVSVIATCIKEHDALLAVNYCHNQPGYHINATRLVLCAHMKCLMQALLGVDGIVAGVEGERNGSPQ